MPLEQLLAELRANPPDEDSPLPWRVDEDDDELLRSSKLDELRVAEVVRPLDTRHIKTAVNVIPALAAEAERLQEELNSTKLDLGVCKDMLREAFSLALSLGAPPHCTLEEAMEYVISFPAKEVERLRAEVAAEKQATLAIAAACLDTGLVPQEAAGTVDAVRAICSHTVALQAELAAVKAAVEQVSVVHAWSCASYTFSTLTPPTKRECDCIAQYTVKAREVLGLSRAGTATYPIGDAP